ncbi:MAG: hypothetical protein V4510_10320 [bacterium]
MANVDGFAAQTTTVESLASALTQLVAIRHEEALQDAHLVLTAFGGAERLDDHGLSPEDRHLFGILEEKGLVSAERHETGGFSSPARATHSWRLNLGQIQSLACAQRLPEPPLAKRPVHETVEARQVLCCRRCGSQTGFFIQATDGTSLDEVKGRFPMKKIRKTMFVTCQRCANSWHCIPAGSHG